MIEIDASEVRALEVDLGKIPGRVVPEVEKVFEKAALNIKDDLTAQAQGSAHFRGMAGSMSYSRTGGARRIEYEVGPDKSRRGGALGNIFFFGGANGGGGTGDIDKPLREEEPRLTDAIDSALGSAFGGLL
ncbi:MAG: hypothetical protein ACTHW7_09820 [Actinomycetaceae bacterium]